ncbi:MAG: class I SAM-dependent RNA methyltransferase [Fibrobacter sp.]|nr:class I SAM-dependent RNA methyltransferase [Fibrobacter sp.]
MVFELRIEKMVQGGEGMSRLPDGRVCFVAGGLPGELCKVALTFQKKDFTKGKVVEVLEPSPYRVKPKCPLYGRCGGCSLQHLDSEKQAEFLAQVERENFRRLAHADLPENFKVHTGSPWGYRNRARVVYCGSSNGRPQFGFRLQESNKVIPFENCPVLTPALNEFLQGSAQQIFVAENAKIRRDMDINLFDNGVGQVSYFYRGMPASEFREKSVSVVDIGGRKIESDASVFFQSNLGLLPELVKCVREAVDAGVKEGLASNEWLIDLFSGVGFFAALLQDKFKRITTVERDDGCLKHARVNLAQVRNCDESTRGDTIRGVNYGDESAACKVENVSAPAEEWLLQNVVDVPATLIVDPPRTGLPKEALEAIAKSSVKQMIYVSCDPVTLARDFAKLHESGFEMKSADAFAFYPQTPHMEMMLVLVR